MNKQRKEFLDLIFYQIYPRSFYDSNGDGVGDIPGIIKKLDYLVDLGVNAVWLSPCYKSPNYDNGYDISDYRDIMEEFGTFAQWKEMLEGMRARGIKLIMDLVANHVSTQHPWFIEGRKSRDNPYHDYFYWADTPPNAWQSVFGGSAWEYNPPTGEYYLHSFAVQQADLNWTNPQVRKEMRDVVDFWVEQGVDGFRCDVLDFISKDFAEDKMLNGPYLHAYIKELFGREKTKRLFIVGECQAGADEIAELCGEDREELTCIFQFEHFNVGREGRFKARPYEIAQVRDILVKWQKLTAERDLLYTLFTDNHDQQRYITRLGSDEEYRYEVATMYATMFYLLKGVPFIYQGQEFGTTGSWYENIEDFDDVETRNYYRAMEGKMPKEKLIEEINFGSRDNARRPMAWTTGKNYGFSEGDSVWLPPYTRGKQINAERENRAEKSILKFYKQLLRFRRSSPAIRYGEFNDLTRGDDCFVYERRQEGERVLVVCNFDRAQTLELRRLIGEEKGYKLALSNYKKKEWKERETFAPYEILVLQKKG